MLQLVLAMLVGLGIGTSVSADSAQPKKLAILTVDKTRTVRIDEQMEGPNSLAAAATIETLANKSTLPIYMVLTSPGGSIAAGEIVESSMDMAISRGIEIRCVVPVLAASMAFELYTHCTSRFALPKAKLLFHPPRIMGSNEPITAAQAAEVAEELGRVEEQDLEHLHQVMPTLDKDLLAKAYYQERLWNASDLSSAAPGFLTLVTRIDGLDGLFAIKIK